LSTEGESMECLHLVAWSGSCTDCLFYDLCGHVKSVSYKLECQQFSREWQVYSSCHCIQTANTKKMLMMT